jgi:hypothetical protein
MNYTEILDRVFTQVSYMLKKKYPKLNCTTKRENIGDSQFPTLYMSELQTEVGNDLENVTINAVQSTIEIQAYTKNSETYCKEIMSEAVTEMKRFRFYVISMPTVTTSGEITTGVARFRRIVGSGDEL